ncbi:hypothetical protein Tco_1535647, partial [Tanacetum coccineum]
SSVRSCVEERVAEGGGLGGRDGGEVGVLRRLRRLVLVVWVMVVEWPGLECTNLGVG